jgi:hypothetical protein
MLMPYYILSRFFQVCNDLASGCASLKSTRNLLQINLDPRNTFLPGTAPVLFAWIQDKRKLDSKPKIFVL